MEIFKSKKSADEMKVEFIDLLGFDDIEQSNNLYQIVMKLLNHLKLQKQPLLKK